MEASLDQRITELCKQVIETDTPLDQIQMTETGKERDELIAAVRAKVARLFNIDTPTNFKNTMMERLGKARGWTEKGAGEIHIRPGVTNTASVPAPRQT